MLDTLLAALLLLAIILAFIFIVILVLAMICGLIWIIREIIDSWRELREYLQKDKGNMGMDEEKFFKLCYTVVAAVFITLMIIAVCGNK